MIIRLAEKHDLPAICSIENLLFDEGDAISVRSFRNMIALRQLYTIDLADAKCVGSLVLLSRKNSPYLRIYSISTHPDHQKKGIGLQLLEFAKAQILASNKMKGLRLEVSEENTSAQHLYKKAGFIETGLKLNYYANGSNAIKMQWDKIN
jgi:ribosomal protein S18 acetylase RimI-like enzyme